MSLNFDLSSSPGDVERLDAASIDALPDGAIRLERDGTVLLYNRTESLLAGYSAEAVVGRNFFTDVAPCTRVQEFHGRFLEGVQRKHLHVRFRFTFRFAPPRGDTDVLITLFYSATSDTVWVFVRR